MSTSVDNRVVQMNFDNRQFENNVQTSLSTLDKLKNSLNLSDCAKGFEDLDRAAGQVDFNGLGSAVQVVQAKFSALEVMAITALANITNSAINAGKRIASSLTIEPIKTGFSEYETQINAVQTILANTQGGQKKVSQEAIDSINETAAASVVTTQLANEESLKNLKKSQEKQLKEFTKLANKELDVLQDKYEDESDALEKALKEESKFLQQAHQEKLAMYEEEYMQKLKVADEELYNKLKAIDDEIDAINALTEAEDEALKKQKEQQKLDELQSRLDNALGVAEKEAAEAALAEYKEELSRQQLEEERKAQIDNLEASKDAVYEEYNLAVEKIQQEYAEKAAEEYNLYELQSELLNEQQAEMKKGLKEYYDSEKELLKEQQDEKKDALKEQQEAEIAALQEKHQLALDNIEVEKNAQIRALSAANTDVTKGSTLEDVNRALDELNQYADKTIYNFTEMTRNIGTFTAAGVDLDTSVKAIKGIANLAAVSGSSSQQASTAMYQLSQALASGRVTLMDWNSVINAGMGGQVFQDALKETARVHGVAIDEIIASQGSFRESLSQGWLSSEILLDTLAKFTGDLTKDQLKTMGYTEEQITSIIKMGETANDAATKVKTFTQLFDTLKEAAQSGWTQSWEIIVGDFEEAKELLTSVSDIFGGMINESANARNELLQGWKDLGGRNSVIQAVKNAFEGVRSVITPIKEAFREIFPRTTSEQLYNITKSIENFTSKLKLSKTQSENLKTTFEGLFSVLNIIKEVFVSIWKSLKPLIGGIASLASVILSGTGSIGSWISSLNEAIEESNIFGLAVEKISTFLTMAIDKIREFGNAVKDKFEAPGFITFVHIMQTIWDFLSKIGAKISEVCGKIGSALVDALRAGDVAEGLDVLNGGIFAAILLGIKNFVNNLKGAFDDVGGMLGTVKSILNSVKDCFVAYQESLKAKTLLTIAAAIGILAASILVISTIDSAKLAASLGAIAVLFGELMVSMGAFGHVSGTLKGVIKTSAAMISMSLSLLILSAALKKIASIDSKKLITGLAGIGALMAELALFLDKAKMDGKIASTSFGLMLLATAVVVLAQAVEDFSEISTKGIIKGLAAIGVVLLELTAFTKLIGNPKGIVSTSAAMILLGAAMKVFASAVSDFGSMDKETLVVGLVALATALSSVALSLNLLPNNMVGIGIGLIAVATALKILTSALNGMGGMTWEEIAKGVSALGLAMLELAVGLNYMNGTLSGSAALLVAASALAILTPVLKVLGEMSWTSIAKGIVSLAGTFVILGVAGVALSGLVPVILALSASIALIGVGITGVGAGLVLVGVGLSAIATGLGALATIGAASATAIVAAMTIIITGIAALIPAVIKKLGEGIVVICESIIDAVPAICEMVVTVVSSVVEALVETIPIVVEGVFTLLASVLTTLVEYTPTIVQSVLSILISCLQSIANNISMVVQTAIDVVLGFIAGVTEKLPEIVDAGFKMMISFINGLSEAVENNADELVKAVINLVLTIVKTICNMLFDAIGSLVDLGADLIGGLIDGMLSLLSDVADAAGDLVGEALDAIGGFVGDFIDAGADLIEGFIEGIGSVVGGAIDAVGEFCGDIYDGICDFFGIHSPSRLMMEVGNYIDEGVAIGISDNTKKVTNAADKMGNDTVRTLSDAISGISDVINSDMDAEPIIRPVLDLTDVQNGTNSINRMLSGIDGYALNGSTTIAQSAARSMRANNPNTTSIDTMSQMNNTLKDLVNRPSVTNNNNFSITGNNPKEIADEVSIILQRQVERRDAAWA